MRTPEEMRLIFLILVLCSYTQNPTANPPPPGPAWRPSRYIIDNRRNALFSKKPTSVLVQDPSNESATYRFGFKQGLFAPERYHKDLAAEASITEPKFYQRYGDNSLPGKIVRSYRLTGGFESPPEEYASTFFESRKNTSGGLDPQDLTQNENDVAEKVLTTTEKVQTWLPNINESPSTTATSRIPQKVEDKHQIGHGIPTTASYPWEIAKTEQGNQIDNANEKHVYETRIETVSYHQEVIFNPPKKENWYREEPKNYERPEKNYERPEENYERPEENYEEPEKNYEEPEKSYEEPEKNYEEPEKNYEEPEKNYEEPEKNYELDESANVMPPDTGNGQNKFGYVVEGTNYRKYRVEERTVDGFIVGEYGVVSHDDGSLRGVRYTADGNTNPKLIYETLIKFLSL